MEVQPKTSEISRDRKNPYILNIVYKYSMHLYRAKVVYMYYIFIKNS